MSEVLNCIAIDDDPLLLRKLEVYMEDISWINFLASYSSPVKGATAIVESKPDLVLLDIEMPHIDGHYLIDWIKPRLDLMEKPPTVIIVSSLTVPKEDQAEGIAGYINKANVTSPAELEAMLKEIIG
ncbi:MAG: response regulator [Cyclobacteriaceae bacterium]